jgi:2'-5' RNA ligase
MDGVLRGIDVFPPSKGSDGKVVAFVPAYVGGIGRLRRELEDLSASEHKDWKPHVTLAYLEEGDGLPAPHPAVPLRFTHLHVKRGDDVVSFPLTGRVHER